MIHASTSTYGVAFNYLLILTKATFTMPRTMRQRRWSRDTLSARFEIEFGTEDPRQDYILGGNVLINQDRSISTTFMN